MGSAIRQHAGGGLVAAGIVAASVAEGLFEPKAYAAASIVIWAAVIAGLGSRALPTNPITATAATAGICLAAIAALSFASVAWAGDQGRAFAEAVRASMYLGLFVLAASTANRGGREQWIGGLSAGLGAVAVLALFAHLQPGLLEGGELRQAIPELAGRLSYPLGYWNGTATLLAVAAVLLADAGLRAPHRLLRSVAIGLMPLALLAIWLASSRGAAAALVVGLGVLVAAAADRHRQLLVVSIGVAAGVVLVAVATQMDALTGTALDAARRADGDRMTVIAVVVATLAGLAAWALDGRAARFRVARPVAIALAAVAALGLLAGVVAADPARLWREFTAPPAAVGPSGVEPGSADLNASGRWQFWGEALDAFGSAPAAGIGAGGYEDWWARHATLAVFVRNPHSLPLQQAAELGALGFAALLGFGVAAVAAARRRLAASREGDAAVLVAVLAVSGIGAAIDWTWLIPAVFAPAVVAAGLLMASTGGRSLSRHAYSFGLATFAVAWVALIAGALVVLTEIKLEQSRDAAGESRYADAIERALEAHTVQPWSPEPYTQLALLEEARGQPKRAMARLEEAQERDSKDWRLLVIEARLHYQSGDEISALGALERATELNPRWYTYAGQR